MLDKPSDGEMTPTHASAMLRDEAEMSWLQKAIVGSGLLAALSFIVAGLAWDLHLYGDGSIFAYLVAVQDSWGVHWHNISGRVTAYLASCLPGELYVALTGDARGGMTFYALLFYAAQVMGLAGTYLADRSPARLIFTAACLSTLCLCPLVFGFPTEMWYAHALFWPTLALAHYARHGAGGALAVTAAFVALVHTHGGGAIFAGAVVFTTALRTPTSTMRRSIAALVVAMAVWAIMQAAFRPDGQISPVLMWAAMNFIDPRNLLKPVMGLIAFASFGTTVIYLVLDRLAVRRPVVVAVVATGAVLVAYWTILDRSVLAEDRYFLRTALFYGTPLFGLVAMIAVLQRERQLVRLLAILPDAARLVAHREAPAVIGGMIGLVALVHIIETGKFVVGWTSYAGEIRKLSNEMPHKTETGDPRPVSSDRVPLPLQEFSWASTTHYLSVVVNRDLSPRRLVVNPYEGYQWITCPMAKRHMSPRAVPERTRRLIEAHACATP